LWIRRGDSENISEIKWPNIHNFNMHDFRMGSDLYSMTGQAVISSGLVTRGTTWNGRDTSEINLSTMAAFDNRVDNYIHIDLSSISGDGPRKDREADLLVADWNAELAGREITETDLGQCPQRYPYKTHVDNGEFVAGVPGIGDAQFRMIAPMREELDDMLPYECYYPYLYVIGVRDATYELIA